MIHELKTDPKPFLDVYDGLKTFEIRPLDRPFGVGDLVHLRETQFTGAAMAQGSPLIYTGREVLAKITHALGGQYGLKEGWIILSIRTLTADIRPLGRSFIHKYERDGQPDPTEPPQPDGRPLLVVAWNHDQFVRFCQERDLTFNRPKAGAVRIMRETDIVGLESGRDLFVLPMIPYATMEAPLWSIMTRIRKQGGQVYFVPRSRPPSSPCGDCNQPACGYCGESPSAGGMP